MTGSGRDKFGFVGPGSAEDPPRRNPEANFPTGPDVGDRLPKFQLPNQHGELVDFSTAGGPDKAALIFHRSAVW
jgi:hypothetical protein